MSASDGPVNSCVTATSNSCAGASAVGVLVTCISAGIVSFPPGPAAFRIAAMTPVAVMAGVGR